MTLAHGVALDPWLAASLAVGGLVTAVLAGLGLAAYLRRGSRPYLLVALALVALFARTLVGGMALGGLLAGDAHHLLEHGLDVVLAALVVAAVVYARDARTEGEHA